ncbi:hypothetical protein ACX93W_05285 [Paenibacillus sp. CAU 1782]
MEKETKDKSKAFPTKKDLFYWILILLVFLILVSVWRTDDPGKLVDEISLGGTFFSILLAVIAIIFSFVQSSDSSRSTNQIADKIAAMSHSLSELLVLKKELDRIIAQQKKTADLLDKDLKKMRDTAQDDSLKSEANQVINSYKLTNKLLNNVDYDLMKWHNEILAEYKALIPFIKSRFVTAGELGLNELLAELESMNIEITVIDLHLILTTLQSEGFLEKDNDYIESTNNLIYFLNASLNL